MFTKNVFLKKYIIYVSFSFIMLFVFLFIIQPIDIYNMGSQINKYVLILLFSINFAFVNFIELIYLSTYKTTTPKIIIKKHIIFSGIIIITSIFILYVRHPFMTKHHFFQYLSAIFVIVGLFQLIIFFLLKNYFTENNIIKNSNINNDRAVIFDSKTVLNVNVNDIIFIKSEGNYVTVFEKNKKYLIRSSLKKIIEQNKNTSLIRCHKSYIINSNKIKSITGNSKGYKIYLLDYEFEIPASVEIGEKLKITII